MIKYLTDISNVLVIGCGGAGLRAAIEVKKEGLNVKIIGKRHKKDAHTVLAAGGINASFGNVDIEDSWEQHFLDTYLEGYEIGNIEHIEIMAKESPLFVTEIDRWGANFSKLGNGKLDQRFFGAHTYRRTCYSGDYTGQSILNTLLKKVKELEIPILDNQYVTDLLLEDNKCFGALSFNTSTGDKTVFVADAVILCTGGHTRNWKRSSSRKQENYGDGYHLALKAGCSLTDMEMVQFHPTGMLKPEDIAGTLVTEAVRGEGGKLFNSLGERFMVNYDKEKMELSTRDKVAIANYTEIIEGRCTPNGGVYLDISHKEKDFILKKIPKIYRQFLEAQMLDISKKPMEVAPTAHYSMGGIKVTSQEHATSLSGLFAAGEVAGGLHGANRLGGNSLAEILVFGARAGKYASIYSKNLSIQIRSKKRIKLLIEKINNLIKKGEENSITLQNELANLMWKHCGVVKSEKSIKEGIKKIKSLKKRSEFVDVRIEKNNVQDLINLLNLKSSIITSEATLLSSLARRESRGAHQRSDYKNFSKSENYNYLISMENNNSLVISKEIIKPLEKKYKDLLIDRKIFKDFKNRLLE